MSVLTNKMMQIDAIERYVDQVLEVNGVVKGTEGQERLLLSHLYTAVGMYQLLDKTQKAHIAMLQKQLRHFFYAKCDLKERKRKKDKEKTPLHPSIKEKENKEKEQKILFIAARRENFRNECLKYVDKFDNQRLADFFNYWSEENKKDGKMRFEKQRFWNIERRLKRWMNISYSVDNTAAALRLEKAKKGKTKEQDSAKQQQALVAQRDESNEQLFHAIEESKRKAISHEEYLAQKNSRDENEG